SDLSQWVEVPYYTGIDEQEQGLSIYPNPTADKVVIECEGMTRVEVYNVEGKRVSAVETQGDSYEVDGLQNGVYMLRIFKGDVVIVRKVVKM
ncbi:MAG: T9SS type A sorting domain-containing protein, partial [Bacteroidales bacterium]|nr:T9SS type A sorting domain-containing protein [Bacteroidales bacterium]